jgi:hypothetical protein
MINCCPLRTLRISSAASAIKKSDAHIFGIESR